MSVFKTLRALLPGVMLSILLMPILAHAQKVEFAAKLSPADARAGEGAQVIVTAKIPAGYHMYSLTQDPNGGVPLKIEPPSGALTGGGKVVGSAFKKVPEPTLKLTLEEYSNAATFAVPVMLKAGIKGSQNAALKIKYQICNEKVCLPPAEADVPITFSVTAGAARANRKKPVLTLPAAQKGKVASAIMAYPGVFILAGGPPKVPPASPDLKDSRVRPAEPSGLNPNVPPAPAGLQGRQVMPAELSGLPPNAPPAPSGGAGHSGEHSQGLLPFLLVAIAAGFTSLLTPCVFPMIPITVSFFTKRKEGSGVSGIRGALAYCLGIIGTFTGLGLLMTVLFGATGIQNFAANPWVNVALGTLFVVLAANLLGAFEILLPSWLLNKTQSAQSAQSGLIAPLLMGLTFSLTSFTCTSPFVGTVLLDAAHGHYLYPFVGMLAFSAAFALPFFLLALFPQALAKLPKSGSWLVTVKAVMGFLELAAALKFFSSADLTWGAGLLTKPVFLAIWAGIAAITGLYLLGWLRLPHDDKAKVGIARRILGVLTLLGCVACLAAIQGRSLGEDLDSFVPPTPYPYRNQPAKDAPGSVGIAASDIGTPQKPLMNFEEAVKLAKERHKPIFIDFTGYVCTNCRKMEGTTLINPDVLAELKNYVCVELHTDRADAENKANQQLQQKLVKTVALPVYAAVTSDGETVVAQTEGLTAVQPFIGFLKEGRGSR